MRLFILLLFSLRLFFCQTLFANESLIASKNQSTPLENEELKKSIQNNTKKKALIKEYKDQTNKKITAPKKSYQLYKDEDLLTWIKRKEHLKIVKRDKCQLHKDIKAQAAIAKRAIFEFLYADMLINGVCYPQNVNLGFYFLEKSTTSGFADAFYYLGFYNENGKYFAKNLNFALYNYMQAASFGHKKATLASAKLYSKGLGSPYDYKKIYGYLVKIKTKDKKELETLNNLLVKIATLIPKEDVLSIKNMLN